MPGEIQQARTSMVKCSDNSDDMSQSPQMKSVSVFAPISIGNVSVGFDCLGLALKPIDGDAVGDQVTVDLSTETFSRLSCRGKMAHVLPEDEKDNIVWHCLVYFNQKLRQKAIEPQALDVLLEKNIPICSGVGSSACSVVAALEAFNQFYGAPFDQNQMLIFMGELEAQISGSLHYDNVAPCYLGGLQLMLPDDEAVDNAISHSIPTIDECYWVLAYPDIAISTKMAREILPAEYSRDDLICYGKRLAGFIDASYRQDKVQAFALLKDVVAEPYRESLLPNFKATKTVLEELGCFAVGISGSGPSLFAVCDTLEQAQQAKQAFSEYYLTSDQSFAIICKPDNDGARVVQESK